MSSDAIISEELRSLLIIPEIPGRTFVYEATKNSALNSKLIEKIKGIFLDIIEFSKHVAQASWLIPKQRLYFENSFSIEEEINTNKQLVVSSTQYWPLPQKIISWQIALKIYLSKKISEIADLFPEDERKDVKSFFLLNSTFTSPEELFPKRLKEIFEQIQSNQMLNNREEAQKEYEKEDKIQNLRNRKKELIKKFENEDRPFKDSGYFQTCCSQFTDKGLKEYGEKIGALGTAPSVSKDEQNLWQEIIRVWENEIQKPRLQMKIGFKEAELNKYVRDFEIRASLSSLLQAKTILKCKEELVKKIEELEDEIDEQLKQGPIDSTRELRWKAPSIEVPAVPLSSSASSSFLNKLEQPSSSDPTSILDPSTAAAPTTQPIASQSSDLSSAPKEKASSLSENKKERTWWNVISSIFKAPFVFIGFLWTKLKQLFFK